MERIVKHGLVQLMLLPGVAVPLNAQVATSANQQQADEVNSVAQAERAKIMAEIEQTKILLRAVLEAQARQNEVAREALEKQAAARLDKLADDVKAPSDFGGPRAQEFRKQLAERTAKIRGISIDASTPPETVDEYLASVKEAAELTKTQLAQFQEDFRSATDELPKTVKEKLDQRIPIEKLESLGKEKLASALKKLNPGLSDEDLAKLAAAGKLSSAVMEYTKDGKWSPEMLAAFGDDFKTLTGIEVPEGWDNYVGFAKDVVDAYRTADDFSDFARGSLQAALSTGNPYVIGATVAILALIALFNALFGGGGGGGDGDGDGEGRGDQGRNRQAGAPAVSSANEGKGRGGTDTGDTREASKPRPKGKPVKVPVGTDVYPVVDGDLLTIYPADAGPEAAPIFSVDLSKLVYDDGTDGPFQSGADLQEIVSITIAPSPSLKLRTQDADSQNPNVDVIRGEDGRFVLLRGVDLATAGDANGKFRLRLAGKMLRVHALDGKVVSADGATFEVDTESGIRDHQGNRWRLDVSKLSDAKIHPSTPLSLNFRYQNAEGVVRYTLERGEDGRWTLTKPFPEAPPK